MDCIQIQHSWLASKKKLARITNESIHTKNKKEMESPWIGKKLEIWRREGGVGGIWYVKVGWWWWGWWVETEEEEKRWMPSLERGKEREWGMETLEVMKEEGEVGEQRVMNRIDWWERNWASALKFPQYGKTSAWQRSRGNAYLPRVHFALSAIAIFHLPQPILQAGFNTLSVPMS